MPEHVHLLFTPTVTLERALQLIKGGYSHRFGSEFGRNKKVWESGFTDHSIRDAQDFETHFRVVPLRLARMQLFAAEVRCNAKAPVVIRGFIVTRCYPVYQA